MSLVILFDEDYKKHIIISLVNTTHPNIIVTIFIFEIYSVIYIPACFELFLIYQSILVVYT